MEEIRVAAELTMAAPTGNTTSKATQSYRNPLVKTNGKTGSKKGGFGY